MRPMVLLVEPEPMLRLTMTKFLQSAGHGVTACPDVDAALRVLRSTTPHLIVRAVRVLDGQALADIRRLRDGTMGIPLLGVADIAEVPTGAALPDRVRFLAPPFDMPDLLRAVRSSLRESHSRPSLELEA